RPAATATAVTPTPVAMSHCCWVDMSPPRLACRCCLHGDLDRISWLSQPTYSRGTLFLRPLGGERHDGVHERGAAQQREIVVASAGNGDGGCARDLGDGAA